MTFDLFVSRTSPWDEAPPSAAIPEASFHAFYANVPGARAEGGPHPAYRVPRAEDPTDAWFVASLRPGGFVVLATSYTHVRFIRNCADLFDHGLALADALGASLFEEVGARTVTRANVAALVARKGDYLALVASTGRTAAQNFHEQAMAPLDYPMGAIDSVTEYMMFHVTPVKRFPIALIARFLELRLERASAAVIQADQLCVVDAASRCWLTKLLIRPSGVLQIWPAWGQSSFRAVANATIRTAEQLRLATEGTATFNGNPCDPALRAELRRRKDGFATDFYAWTTTLAGKVAPPRELRG